MAQRVVPAIKIKEVVGEPTVAIMAALNDGTIQKQPNGKPATDQYLPLGYFVGRVEDQVEHTSKRKRPDGEEETRTWPKLRGAFRAWSVDPARDVIVSTSAFLMDHLTEHLGQTIKAAHEQDPGATLEVLMEVGVTTSDKSSTGFVWTMRDMAPPEVQADPLAALVARVQGQEPKALPAPKPEPEAEADGKPVEQEQAEADGKSDEQEQAEADTADAVSKDTGGGKEDHGGKGGRSGRR
jgi:hypothetical protein